MTIPAGALRFNSDSGKLEYYNGEAWWQIDNFSADNATGGARGITAGGDTPGASQIEYITISTTGNAITFGTLVQPALGLSGCGSNTRGIFANGNSAGNLSTIQYVTFASTGNSIDSGFDTTLARHECPGVSNTTRGIFGGGESGPGGDTTIDYITIASIGNAVDFGDLTVALRNLTGVNSSTRGIFLGGRNNTPAPSTQYNVIQYVNISTLGNAQDFGDLTQSAGRSSSVCNSVRGIRIGGEIPGTTNRIDYITMASNGNAIDFGDTFASSAQQASGGMSSSTRGVYNVGSAGGAVNNIEYIQIMSTGNAVDFGDSLTNATRKYSISNAHGGL